MLARLISARQVVLLCDNLDVYLFYCGQVYHRSGESSFMDLPTPEDLPGHFIWALIDVDYQDRGPPCVGSRNIWPIQTSSPNPVRWKHWSKQAQAAMLGMDLWSVEELMEGYDFC